MVIFDLPVIVECHSRTPFDLEVGKVKHKHELNDASYTITIDTLFSLPCVSCHVLRLCLQSLAAAARLYTRD